MKRTAVAFLTGLALAVPGVVIATTSPAAAVPSPVDLYAVSGSTTLPDGASVPVYGYATTNTPVTMPGGPVIEATVGQSVSVTLHNQLSTPTGLLFEGQQMPPDLVGVAAGATKVYTFTAAQPGTYLYEAAPITGSTGRQYQTAMGLHGALVVAPATANQAYAAASSAYDDSAVLVLSEIDPALNTSANPASFDMRSFKPRYSLINGQAYPDTAAIPTTAGNNLLLRYVNAGSLYHSMTVLGSHERIIALDGSPLTYDTTFVAETIGPGQTADAIVAVPASAVATKLPVYDGSLVLHSSSAQGMGGMLTTINASGVGTPGGVGPAARAVVYNAGSLSATLDDTGRGGENVTAGEYFIDAVGAPGDGSAVAPFPAPGVTVDMTVALPPCPANTPATPPSTTCVNTGEHILYVRARDDAGNWGSVSSVLVNGGDASGPTTTAPSLDPRLISNDPAAPSGGVTITATADDRATGGSTIAAAEYFIDVAPPADGSANGTGAAMTVNNTSAVVASIDGTIPQASLSLPGVPEGPHVVYIHSQDSGGSWGEATSVPLLVDNSSPTIPAETITATPDPSNGLVPYASGTGMVRVAVPQISDPMVANVQSGISRGELFIDTVGTTGSGIPLSASDGLFNSPEEGAYADIPLSMVRVLANGTHTFHVHARDAAGNWGRFTTGTLLVDKTGPAVSGLAISPEPTLGAFQLTLTGSVTDNLTDVTRIEWFTGADPGAGLATPMTVASGSGLGPMTVSSTIDVSTWGEGSYTLKVRGKDAATNWGPVATVVAHVTAPLEFSTAGASNPPGVGGTAAAADLYSWDGGYPTGAFARRLDVSPAPYGVPNGANMDGFDRLNATQFYASFSDTNTNLPGVGNVQDEDIVFWNGSAWSVYFDGTSHGLTANNQDLDAISVVSPTQIYFSTVGNTNPPGVAGAADDADIYRYDGGSSYTRYWDASANGLAAGANVDGYVRADDTHFYLSFSPTSTTVPGVGTVQDEDVVYRSGTGWSVYFDGTAHGLTSNNLDVDAFDVPASRTAPAAPLQALGLVGGGAR